jgi:iron complex transport system substrate-binding protein
VLGREAEAEVLANYCETTLAVIEDILEQVGDERVRLLYCVGDTGLSVIPTGSFLGELLNLVSDNQAVVENPSSKGTGNEVDMEQILQWDPDWILFAPDSIYDTVLEEPAWRELTAIKSGNFYKVPFGPYNWMGFPPSVNRYLGMLWTVKLFYPDHADYDLYEKVEEYFDLFYQSAITPEQFGRLTQDSLPQ